MLQIIVNDKHYRAFIKYAISTCDSFSLVFEKDENDRLRYVFQEFHLIIAEFILNTKSVGDHPDTGTFSQNSEINYFECNKHTGSALQTANSIFDWDGKNLPEELCFYRGDEKWFVCVSHEKYLFIHNETKDDIAF